MTTDAGAEQPRSPRRARRPAKSEPPIDLAGKVSRPTPTDRYEGMARERIDGLERDKAALRDEIKGLQADVRRLGPENERLKEALGNARANGLASTSLVLIGGGAISYAAFVPGASKEIAAAGAAGLVAGVVIMVVQAVRARTGHGRPD